MAYIKNRIIHRFIRDITEYLENGVCYGQVLPVDTQVYAEYSKDAGQVDEEGNPKIGLYYVIGDGIHTYTEIRDGHGENRYNKEYLAFESDSSVLKDVRLHDLKDGQMLQWNEEQHRWINIRSALIPLELLWDDANFDCGKAQDEYEEILDGGNAGAYHITLLDAGKGSPFNYNVEFITWTN